MKHDLAAFWEELETNFPLGGVRSRLEEKLGGPVTAALERLDVLRPHRRASRFPCPNAAASGCYRNVVEDGDGEIVAVCGNSPTQCEDVVLSARDVEIVGIRPQALCTTLAQTLSIRPKFEVISGIRNVYRVGTFIPSPGVKHPVYLAVRCSASEYSQSLDALRARLTGRAFGALVPTERFIGEDLRQRMDVERSPIVPLVDSVQFDDRGAWHPTVSPMVLLGAIGSATKGPSSAIMATAFIGRGDGRPHQQNLDEDAYHELLKQAGQYDVFADERTRQTRIRGEIHDNVPNSHFRLIRGALESRSRFDPGSVDDLDSGKQLFQRARSNFDIKTGREWLLFQTEKVDSAAYYRFAPPPDISYAFIFSHEP